MDRPRDLRRLRDALGRSSIVLLTGPRQAGKSTLAGEAVAVAPSNFFDLEDPRDDARLAAMCLQYHDLRPDRGLAGRVGLERLTTDAEVERAVTEPPTDTRAYFRGTCLQRWSDQIVAANWDSMVFDVGGDPLRRVPMMDPTRGTEAHVGRLMAECSSTAELVNRLGQ